MQSNAAASMLQMGCFPHALTVTQAHPMDADVRARKLQSCHEDVVLSM